MNLSKVVISIPHCGTFIPQQIREMIPHEDHILNNEADLFTKEIYSIPDVRLVSQNYSRIISDTNRAPDEFYLTGKDRLRGVTMLNLHNNLQTFTQDPSLEEMKDWVESFHKPYHQQLSKVVKDAHFLIDCHSMFSYSEITPDCIRPDISIGNQFYSCCSMEITNFFRDYYKGKGYKVSINDPYPGRYILSTYCSRHQLSGLQIEINRKLFMDEDTLEPNLSAIKKLNQEFHDLVTEFVSKY